MDAYADAVAGVGKKSSGSSGSGSGSGSGSDSGTVGGSGTGSAVEKSSAKTAAPNAATGGSSGGVTVRAPSSSSFSWRRLGSILVIVCVGAFVLRGDLDIEIHNDPVVRAPEVTVKPQHLTKYVQIR